MLHPSYTDLMKVVNSEVEEGNEPVVSSRYSIVMATSKRARQLISGDEALIEGYEGKKPLSVAVEELDQAKIKILNEDEDYPEEQEFENQEFENQELESQDSEEQNDEEQDDEQ
ncbi:MAG: DNA-directed RNA polymerase subunit omega [Lachnospiraceae bacterium]|nr:DNA-directed RNA polymerase subunit omega [Lachnospiraceae bacterium]